MVKAMPTLSPAGSEVRQHDPDHFLTTLFAPEQRREDLFILYAFAAEVARIPTLVSEPVLGHMRLQWWREALGEGVPSLLPPLALALREMVARRGLSVGLFEAMIDSIAHSLDNPFVPDDAPLQSRLEACGGGLARLAWQVLDGEAGGVGDHAAHHAGMAYALAVCLRSAASTAAMGRSTVPGLDLTDKTASALRAAQMARQAVSHMGEARRLLATPGQDRVAAFLPLVIAEGILHRLARAGDNLLDASLALPLRRPWVMTWRAWRGRY